MNWKRVLISKWSWKRPFISLLWIYVLLGVVAVFFGDRLLFMPPVPSYERGSKDLVSLTTSAGEQIDAFHFPAAPGMPTLLYSHGNAEDIGQGIDLYHECSSCIASDNHPSRWHGGITKNMAHKFVNEIIAQML